MVDDRGIANTTSDELELIRLSSHFKSSVRERVAANPRTPVGILLGLAVDEDYSVRQAVIANPSMLIDVSDYYVPPNERPKLDETSVMWRWSEARATTSPSVLERLSNDENSNVRSTVAMNPSTPVRVLEELSNDDDEGVRGSAASNPNTSPAVLEQLAHDDLLRVRWKVAANPNAPIEALLSIGQAELDVVRENRPTETYRRVLERIRNRT